MWTPVLLLWGLPRSPLCHADPHLAGCGGGLDSLFWRRRRSAVLLKFLNTSVLFWKLDRSHCLTAGECFFPDIFTSWDVNQERLALLKHCTVLFFFFLVYDSVSHFQSVSNLQYDLALLCPVNTMLPVTLEKPTVFLYITITFFHTPLRPGPVME